MANKLSSMQFKPRIGERDTSTV